MGPDPTAPCLSCILLISSTSLHICPSVSPASGIIIRLIAPYLPRRNVLPTSTFWERPAQPPSVAKISRPGSRPIQWTCGCRRPGCSSRTASERVGQALLFTPPCYQGKETIDRWQVSPQGCGGIGFPCSRGRPHFWHGVLVA